MLALLERGKEIVVDTWRSSHINSTIVHTCFQFLAIPRFVSYFFFFLYSKCVGQILFFSPMLLQASLMFVTFYITPLLVCFYGHSPNVIDCWRSLAQRDRLLTFTRPTWSMLKCYRVTSVLIIVGNFVQF